MDKQSSTLLRKLIYSSTIVVEKDYAQLAIFNNVILAGKENRNSSSGFSFLIIEFNEKGDEVFKGNSDEFQNANTIFVLRANLNLSKEKAV